jgi:hypothetical protein
MQEKVPRLRQEHGKPKSSHLWHHLPAEFLNFVPIGITGYLVLRRPERGPLGPADPADPTHTGRRLRGSWQDTVPRAVLEAYFGAASSPSPGGARRLGAWHHAPLLKSGASLVVQAW